MLNPIKRFFRKRYSRVDFIEEPTLVHQRRGDLAVKVQRGGLHIIELESEKTNLWEKKHGFYQLKYFLRHANYLWLAIPESLYYDEGPKKIMDKCSSSGVGLLIVSGGPKRYRVYLKRKSFRFEGYMDDFLETYTNL